MVKVARVIMVSLDRIVNTVSALFVFILFYFHSQFVRVFCLYAGICKLQFDNIWRAAPRTETE